MASVTRQTHINVPPEQAWAALRDFGAVHDRLAAGFVVSCDLDDDGTRLLTFDNGAVAREALVGIDEEGRRLAYTLVETRLDITHHNGSALVLEEGDGTRFVWSTDVLPDDAATVIGEMMDRGIDAIRRTLEAAAVPAAG